MRTHDVHNLFLGTVRRANEHWGIRVWVLEVKSGLGLPTLSLT